MCLWVIFSFWPHFGSVLGSLVVSPFSRGCCVRGFHIPGACPASSPSDTSCTSLLPMSSMVSLLLQFGFIFFFFFSPSFFFLFVFWLFLFSLFVFFVCFVFLHVQFCKANSRYCISQLVSLQRKFTVSCSLLRYSLNGFLI